MISLEIINNNSYSKIDIINFSGNSGYINAQKFYEKQLLLSSSYECEIKLSNDQTSIWRGFIRFEKFDDNQIAFFLQIKSSMGDLADWVELPRFFSIVDGGYKPLNDVEIGHFLSELIDFQDVTKGVIFFEHESSSLMPIRCSVTMEEISSTDALLIKLTEPTNVALPLNLPLILTVELFEATFIIVGFLEEQLLETIIFSLTRHFYQDQRHSGRKFLTQPIQTNVGLISEISDFGLRIRVYLSKENLGENITVEFKKFGIASFHIIHYEILKNGQIEMGCKILNDESSIRTWSKVLLEFQYPHLVFRESEDYGSHWQILKETGFITNEFEEINLSIKPLVETEWKLVDQNHPTLGAAVVAKSGKDVVGTVSVSKVSSAAWNPGVLATMKNPKYMEQTRELISWYTRFPMQQFQSEWSIVFFSRDKAFLDRFFRKFFLQNEEYHNSLLYWEEWLLYTCVLSEATCSEKCRNSLDFLDLKNDDYFFRIFLNPLLGLPKLFLNNGITFIKGRAFQHLCQYLNSAWIRDKTAAVDWDLIIKSLGDQQIFTLRTKMEIDLKENEPPNNLKIFFDSWDVVWLCHRKLFSKYLTNSLRSLELMKRKYWRKEVI